MYVRIKTTLSKEQLASAINSGLSLSSTYSVEYKKIIDGHLCYKLEGYYIYLSEYFEEMEMLPYSDEDEVNGVLSDLKGWGNK